MIRNKFYDAMTRRIRKDRLQEYRPLIADFDEDDALDLGLRGNAERKLRDPGIQRFLREITNGRDHEWSADNHGRITCEYPTLNLNFYEDGYERWGYLLPVRFGPIAGACFAWNMGFKTLEGCPPRCRAFYCENLPITSLEGGPEGAQNYSAEDCLSLVSLKGAPKQVDDIIFRNTRISAEDAIAYWDTGAVTGNIHMTGFTINEFTIDETRERFAPRP
jgi:hypothetical protein